MTGRPHRFARIAQAPGETIWGLTVWGAAVLVMDAVGRLAADMDIPSLPEKGIPERDIAMLAQLAFDDPQTIGDPRDINVAGYEMIYRSCFTEAVQTRQGDSRMAKAEITSGICGFTASVETQMDGRHCALSIKSDCSAIQRLAQALPEVDPFQEISFRGEGPLALKMGAIHCYHPACPVPVGIVKAVEVEAGLALPAEAKIELAK